MLAYTLRRLGFLVLTLLFTSMIIFTISQLLPGDVARAMLGREASDEAVQEMRTRLGLNDPAPVRYWRWLNGFLRGDWGETYPDGLPILPRVTEALTRSLWLAGVTLAFSIPLSILLGVIAGLNANKPIDAAISVTSLALIGFPEFVTGIVLINVVALQWEGLGLGIPASSNIPPEYGFVEAFPSLILPAITATLVLLAYVVRLTRAGVIEVLKKSYIRTAVLKGLPERTVIVSHVLRNALLPTVTVIAISFGWLISGLVVIENVFGYPGLGKLMLLAIRERDLYLMQAIAMVAVFFYAVANLLADILYAYLNPRIRLE